MRATMTENGCHPAARPAPVPPHRRVPDTQRENSALRRHDLESADNCRCRPPADSSDCQSTCLTHGHGPVVRQYGRAGGRLSRLDPRREERLRDAQRPSVDVTKDAVSVASVTSSMVPVVVKVAPGRRVIAAPSVPHQSVTSASVVAAATLVDGPIG